MKEIINYLIEEYKSNFPEWTEEQIRLMVFEDLRDELKYLMSDVSY